jgi:hypothetical protein
MYMTTTQILPARCETAPEVTVPALRTLTVALYSTSEGETIAVPVNASANDNSATQAAEQTAESVAKTVRPSRKRSAS